MTTHRRDFIKFVVAGTIAAGCPIDSSLLPAQTNLAPAVEGEENLICHRVRDGQFFSRPPITERHDVVIAGGGVSGLTAAYMLRHLDCLLLEKESHWGGNAYTMEYRGSQYATGSAFLSGRDSMGYALAREIGLEPLPVNNWDGTILRGEYVPDTWGEGLDRLPYSNGVREGFKKFRREMLGIDVKGRSRELFNVPFSTFMKAYPPEVRLWWDTYGPSNWGTTSDETPAAIGIEELQSMSSESRQDLRFTWAGGNGEFSKRLVETLLPKYGLNMKIGATTVAIVSERAEVLVTYVLGGELKTAAAKAAIVALPKLITFRIVHGLPETQRAAMGSIRYIPYPVVNLIFDKPVFIRGYDTWCPGNSFTDFIVADWVLRTQSDYRPQFNILTCYTPMREEDRVNLLLEQGARRIAAGVLRDFQKLFSGSDVDPVEVHIYRRGHPLFMSTLGLYTHAQPLVRQPMDRVFFANSDSEGPEPTIDAAISSAQRCSKQVENRLAGGARSSAARVFGP